MSELVVLKVNSEERRNGVDGHVIGFLASMLAQTEAKLAEMQGRSIVQRTSSRNTAQSKHHVQHKYT
jgi:hypothetical protein